MNALSSAIDAMTAEFAASILEAIRGSSLSEILEGAPGVAPRRRPGHRPPGSAKPAGATAKPAAVFPATTAVPVEPGHRGRGESTAEDAELIVMYLRSHPGATGEEARKSLGLEKNRWNTCVYGAIRHGRIRKEGERRSTRYWAVG